MLNVIAFFHAYKFTHFSDKPVEKTKNAGMTIGTKLKTLFFGINNPRSKNDAVPSQKYETIILESPIKTECWYIKAENPKGTVIIGHGYSSKKSSLLNRSDAFLEMGYNTLLLDFMGSGGSEGNRTTIGVKEGQQIKMCFDFIKSQGEENILLFGNSMGAAAVMKAMDKYHLQPEAIIIECPFGTMYKTTCARFREMGAPTFPAAALLVFWGGVQNGFWAFSHNPQEYAKAINCPTLLMWGGKDNKVSSEETKEIFNNLDGIKELKIYPEAGHEDYMNNYHDEWVRDVESFLKEWNFN